MDAVSPQDVYARHLVSRRGYPLWTPEPSLTLPDVYRREGLKIRDVGVVVPEDGSFDVLFNICLPPTHSLHQPRGVPDNFTPVPLVDRDIAIFTEAESAGRVISTSSVARAGRQPSDENATRATQPGPLDYEFTLSAREGALLILPEGAERYHLRNQRPFLEEAIQHAVDWYHFAEDSLGRIISHDSLYLITGFYKSRSWSLASYQHASGTGDVRAQFKAVQVGSGNVPRSYTWETTHSLDWRVGPPDQYYNGISNQSIFIQGFKIAVRSSILGAKRVEVKEDFPSVRPHRVTFYGSAKRSRSNNARLSSSRSSASAASASGGTDAELHPDIPEAEFDSDGGVRDDDMDIAIQHVPQAQIPFHPSDAINQCLLRMCPSAVVAITHDVYWTTLLERELVRPEDLMRQDLLEDLVPKMSPVTREGAVYLQDIACDDDDDDDDDDARLGASSDEIDSAQEAGPDFLAEQYKIGREGVGKLPWGVLGAQRQDPYGGKSPGAGSSASAAKPLRPVTKGSEHSRASSATMFKQMPRPTDSKFALPGALAFPRLSIREPSVNQHPITGQPRSDPLRLTNRSPSDLSGDVAGSGKSSDVNAGIPGSQALDVTPGLNELRQRLDGTIATVGHDVPSAAKLWRQELYESRASSGPPTGAPKPLKPVLKGSCTPSGSASTSKQGHRPASSSVTPETPDLSGLSLQEERSADPSVIGGQGDYADFLDL